MNGEPFQSIYDLLDQLRRRPGMFLGSTSADTLEAFISGLSFSKLEPGDPSFWDFKGWLVERVPEISRSFPTTWLEQRHGAQWLSVYFEYLDEYRRCRVAILQRSLGPFSPTFTVTRPPDLTPRAPATPSEIVIGQLVPSTVFFVDVRGTDRRMDFFKTFEAAREDAERSWGAPPHGWTA